MTIKGVIHGRIVELEEDPHFPDGGEVEVSVRPVQVPRRNREAGCRSAGVWADFPEMDEIMADVQRERKSAVYREV